MNISNLKIGVRLAIGFAVTLTLMCAVAVIGYSSISSLDGAIKKMSQDRYPKTVQANGVIDAINNIARNLRNAYIYTGAEQQRALDAIGPERKIITENLEKLTATIRSEKGKAILKKVGDARTAYVASQDKFLELLKADKKADIVVLMQGDLRKAQSGYLASVNELIKFQSDAMEEGGKDAEQAAINAERLLIMLSVIAGLLTIVFAFLITRSITGPTKLMVGGAEKMAAGDFNFKLEVNSKDELGMLANSVRSMQAAVQAMIADAKMLAEAAVAGKLATRADASKHQGDFQVIVKGVNDTLQDITERWRATSALRESENNYHTLADFSPALIWASGTDRAFNYVNQPWLSFTGRSLEQESGNGWAEGVHPEDFQRLIAAYTEAFGRRASFSLEWRLRRHDGEFRWLRNDGCARHDPNGKFIGYLGYCMDITESKAFEHSLIAARVAAESANRVKSEFLANMSHEFRTPLNGILGNAQLLQMSNLGAEEKAYLSDLIASGKKLLSLTNDILDMSKIEAAAMELEQGEFSLRGCVDELMRAHRPRGAGKGPMLKVQIPYEVPDALLGDKVRLKQILNNLLGNAIKFTEEGSITLVAALKERDGGNAIIEICVIDTGIGIAEAAVREIFKPFVQADGSTSRRYGGSGLGLTIAQRLAELMGGSISVQSAEGVGSTFRVLLPFSLAGEALLQSPPDRA